MDALQIHTSPRMDVPHLSIPTAWGDNILASLLLIAAAVLVDVYWRQPRPRRLQRPPAPPATHVRCPRRLWCREWLLRRPLHGHYDHLIDELDREDQKGYKNYLRITPDLFAEMVEKVSPRLTKATTRMRLPLPVGLKLAVTIRHLVTGNSYASLSYSFRVSKSAISIFVPRVCQAIIDAYKDEVMKCPRTPEDWRMVAHGFAKRWQYYNCGGVLDGKHVRILKPKHAGSMFFNYKKFHSIVLMAIADANYKFLYVDVGAEGSAGDGGTWCRSTLHDAIEQQRCGFPDASPLPNDDTPIPFHLVADDAFAMRSWLMKPYSHYTQAQHERIYNYWLSRARRVVENAFGLMQARLRVFATIMLQLPKNAKTITMCGCVLHNLILDRFPFAGAPVDYEDAEYNLVPGPWREEPNMMVGLQHPQAHNFSRQVKAMRDHLAHYYSSEAGAVPWQDRLVYPRGRPQN